MPPQPARSITSYFNKLPSTSPVAKTKASTTGANGGSPSTSNAIGSSPSSSSTPTGQKRSFLSDAARKAIEEGAAEARAAKKPKVNDKVADVFLTTPKAKITLPKATTREELVSGLSSLDAADAEILKLEVDTMEEDWLLALQDELTKPYFLNLKRFVTTEQKTKKVFPPAQQVYSWSTLCPLKDVRIVIVGQDPYHDDGQAHGLAFSVAKGMRIPPSLRNIYKEMSEEYPGFKIPKHGYLGEWAKHGVLLLNTALTVRAHEAGSHSNKGWETFTAAVLRVIIERLSPSDTEGHVPGAKGVVFMAWGAHAQKMCSGVDKKKHLVLSSAHPSPLAASRGFFGNGHFKKANQWLVERYGSDGGIDWESLGDA